uniref:Chitin-binding type-2 domain-containing protein n=1 Tax=Ditylenchus dipsaci TaxID=166011 RepID=A0A915DUV1_9BILA
MALPFTISCYLAFHLICLYLSSKYVFGYVMSPHPSLRCDHLKGRSGLQGYIVPNNCSNLFYSCWNDEVQGPYFCREDQVFNLEVEICEQNGCYGHAPSLALRNNKNKKLGAYMAMKRCLPDNQQPGNSQMTQRIMGGTVVDTNKVAVWLQFDYVTGGWYGNSKEKTVCTGFLRKSKKKNQREWHVSGIVTTLQAKEVDFLCLGDRHIPDTILAEGWGYKT